MMQGAPLVTANKIFQVEDIEEILAKIQDSYDKLKQEAAAEQAENEKFKYEYQDLKLGNFSGYLKYELSFSDGSKTEFDNYNTVKNMIESRLRTLERIYVYYSVSFSIKKPESTETKMVSEQVILVVNEDELKIETSLPSQDSRLTEVYDMMAVKVNAAPEKYDDLIRKKDFVSWKIGVADGLLALAVILAGLIVGVVMVPGWRGMMLSNFWIVPVSVIGLGLISGILLGSVRTARFYNKLIPNKKYAGYDTNTHQSVYNDDIAKFKETSDVLIGAKADNWRLREDLREMEQKARKRSYVELGVIGALMVVLWVACLLGK